MPKGKKDKKGKKSKGADFDLPELYFGTGSFKFPNGDEYEGEYGAHRIGIIWREGSGKYTTHDGQVYEGVWKDDKLQEDTNITANYPNGAKYEGKISKSKYSGPGVYTLENGMIVSCKFRENKPVEDVTLVDVNGNFWVGTAEKDGVLLMPENVYYINISEDSGKGKLKEHTQAETDAAPGEAPPLEDQEPSITSKELEEQIFAKSLKTRDDINFEESHWFKKYQRFIQMKQDVTEKIQNEGIESLDESQKKWLDKYEHFKEKQKQIEEEKKNELMQESEVDLSMLKTFYSKEYREGCKAIKVFYPTSDWFPDYLPGSKGEEVDLCEENAESEMETIVGQ